MTEREAYIIINLIPGIGTIKIQDLLSSFGSATTLLAASKKELEAHYGIGEKFANSFVAWRDTTNIEKELSMTIKAGVEIITIADQEYPDSLKEIYAPPLCLYVRGILNPDTSLNIGIVGSRRTTRYGLKIATHLAQSAVYAGWKVVSGLAYGIDAAAHQSVVDNKGETIAVLGGGLARIHPQEHIPLAKKMLDNNGAIISEFPMESPPTRWSFPMRNRIISGLSRGLIVVEAGEKSGSLITAQRALEQGKSIFAVPGEIDNPQAKGTNTLIKNGAKLTESFDDVLEEFSFISPASKLSQKKETIKENLNEVEEKIIEELKKGSQSTDQLALSIPIPTGSLLATLMHLQIKGLIAPLPGKKYELTKNI